MKKNALFNPYRSGDEDHLYFSDPRLLELLTSLIAFFQIYFRYSVVGLANIPKKGGALLVFNHGIVPIDTVFLAGKIFKILKRRCRVLAHRRSWGIPIFREVALNLGIVNASPENAVRLLERGELVCVFPGGEKEGLKPSSQKYELLWEGRTGFIKTAIQAGVPIIPCMSVGVDEIYYVGKKFGLLPLPLMMGLGAFPLPWKITHYVGKPITHASKPTDAHKKRVVEALHDRVWKESQQLLNAGLQRRKWGGLL